MREKNEMLKAWLIVIWVVSSGVSLVLFIVTWEGRWIGIFVLMFIVPLLYKAHLLQKSMQEHKVRAILLEKGTYEVRGAEDSYTIRYATYEFADGKRHKFEISNPKVHQALRENESGILSYMEIPGSDEYQFVGFEHTGEQPPVRPHVPPVPPPVQPITQQLPVYKPAGRKLSGFLPGIGCGLLVVPLSRLVNIGTLSSFDFWVLLIGAYCVLSLPHWIEIKKMNAMPEQRIEATVLEKGQARERNYIVFSLANGTTKVIIVKSDTYTVLIKGDRGMLTFKEREDDTKFIAFKRNENGW